MAQPMDPTQWLINLISGQFTGLPGAGGSPGIRGTGDGTMPAPGTAPTSQRVQGAPPMMPPPQAAPLPMAQMLSPFDTGSRPPPGGAGMGMSQAMANPASMGAGPTNIVPQGMAAAMSPGGTGGFDAGKLAALQALTEPQQEEPLPPPSPPRGPSGIDPGMLFEALMKMGISPAQIPQLSQILRRQ